jgi:hypothetical protein
LASIPKTAALWVLKSMLAGDLLGWQSILARAWRIAEFCRTGLHRKYLGAVTS